MIGKILKMSCGWQSLKLWLHSLRTVIFTRESCNRVCIALSKQNHLNGWSGCISLGSTSQVDFLIYCFWVKFERWVSDTWSLAWQYVPTIDYTTSRHTFKILTTHEEFKHQWRIKKSMKMFSKPICGLWDSRWTPREALTFGY